MRMNDIKRNTHYSLPPILASAFALAFAKVLELSLPSPETSVVVVAETVEKNDFEPRCGNRRCVLAATSTPLSRIDDDLLVKKEDTVDVLELALELRLAEPGTERKVKLVDLAPWRLRIIIIIIIIVVVGEVVSSVDLISFLLVTKKRLHRRKKHMQEPLFEVYSRVIYSPT